jgi:hypothetical protein
MIRAGDLVLCIGDNWEDPNRLDNMVSRIHVKLAPIKGSVWLVTAGGETAMAPGVNYFRLYGLPDEAWFNEDYFHKITMREFLALQAAQARSAN